jgi:C-3',4' desaturase CrtD
MQVGKMHDVIIIGAGVAGLTAAALLAHEGQKVLVLEQNWLPGGCASAYPRHGYVFEAGATTLVGLDAGMPLKYVLDRTGINVEVEHLPIPMQVHMADGQLLTRWQDLDAWIDEAERAFGPKGQRGFWEQCFQRSQQVWASSLQHKLFPPTRLSDYWALAKNARPSDFASLGAAFRSTESLLKKHGLADNPRFRAFVDAQLMITAQNTAEEVNELFGATALCYTNYGNYYVPGGMIRLVNPFVRYIEQHGGALHLRTSVNAVARHQDHYRVETAKNGSFYAKWVISGLPLNNTLPIFGAKATQSWRKQVLPPSKLRGAFTMGIAFRRHRAYDALHHQLHLPTPLPHLGATSIFLSLSHPNDTIRCAEGECIGSISTHLMHADDPAFQPEKAKAEVEAFILQHLEDRDLIRRDHILYAHSSTPKAWEKWTARLNGFVGGYPQYLGIQPWRMKDARLDGQGAYICGDSTYPGQGIPGACLSGIIAVEKLKADHF